MKEDPLAPLLTRLRFMDRLAGKAFRIMFLLGRGENVRASSLYLLRKLKGPDTAPQRALLSVVFASMGDEEEALRLASPEIKDEITHNFSNLALCILGREPLLGALTEPWVLTACSHVSPEYEPLAGYRRWLELRDSLPTQLEYQKSFVISWTAMRDRKTTGGEENVEASLEMLKLSPLESPEAKLHTYTNLAVSLMLLGDDRYQYYLDEVKRGTENEHAHLRVMAYQSLMEFYARTDDEQETMKMARELKRRASKVATWIMSKEPFNRSWLLREVSLNCLSLAKVQYWTGDLSTSSTIRRLISFLRRSEQLPVISTFLGHLRDVELALELGSRMTGHNLMKEEVRDIAVGLASVYQGTGDPRIPKLVRRNRLAIPPFLRHLGCSSLGERLRVELGYC